MSSKKRDKQNFCQKILFFGDLFQVFFVSVCDAESSRTAFKAFARSNAANHAVVSVGNGHTVGKKAVGATAGEFFGVVVLGIHRYLLFCFDRNRKTPICLLEKTVN